MAGTSVGRENVIGKRDLLWHFSKSIDFRIGMIIGTVIE